MIEMKKKKKRFPSWIW